MKIREATLKDLDALNRLHYDFTAYEANKYDKAMSPEWAYSKAGMGYVKKSVEGKKNYVLVLEDKGSIFGFLFASYRKLPGRKGIVTATVEMMYLSKEYRGKGFGSEMFNMFKKWARAKGANRMDTAAFVKNKQAVDFYKSFGFVERVINFEADLK